MKRLDLNNMKMKKFLIVAAASVVFASCTKDYTCSCTNPGTTETNEMIFKTNRKAHATRLCNDWETRTRTAIPEKSEYDCKIK